MPATPLALLADTAKLPKMRGQDDIGFVLTKLVRNRNSVVYHIEKAANHLLAVL